MDKKYIDALLNVILKTDMSDINPRSVEIIPVSYAPDGTRSEDISLICSFRQPETISNAWVAGNILIFTAFDGYLESKYGLKEGDSFKKHYTNLPATSDLEKIEKNTYRIMKIVRNAIQHNMSSISLDAGGYDIGYQFNSTNFKLQISRDGMDFLYTVIISLIQNSIFGMDSFSSTEGHYLGMLQWYYSQVVNKIRALQDDIQPSDLLQLSGTHPKLAAVQRYRIQNPVLKAEDDSTVTFKFRDYGSTLYRSDYVFGNYLLPEELGQRGEAALDETDRNLLKEMKYSEDTLAKQEQKMRQTITFDKSLLNPTWEVRTN